MTNIELQALRRLFMLKVVEAAQYIGGPVPPEQWHRWEQGQDQIPDNVINKMLQLKKERHENVALIIDNINNRVGANTIKYFIDYQDFQKVNPTQDVIHWRLNQSIATELYFRGLEELS
ncbi:DUF1870 family protein [Utexia brackfieldae]|uniref:Aca2/YdiL-like domain-containing protein n=1 Tax=Utexia brackfieldae TaxID=3074108 RepID=UPI00370D02D0